MTHPLDIAYSIPLEREYEAWIIRGVEQYFQSVGKNIAIWAVTPRDEVVWPADESVTFGKKLIGLQMKKPHYKYNGSGTRNFGRLSWTFHNPHGQFDLVSKFPEIYYCLPTFLNRKIKEEALSHCLFWRPEASKRNLNAWYDNPLAKTPYNSISNASRWGKFLEDIVDCRLGKRIEHIDDAKSYVSSLTDYMRQLYNIGPEVLNREQASIETRTEPYVYLLAIPIHG